MDGVRILCLSTILLLAWWASMSQWKSHSLSYGPSPSLISGLSSTQSQEMDGDNIVSDIYPPFLPWVSDRLEDDEIYCLWNLLLDLWLVWFAWSTWCIHACPFPWTIFSTFTFICWPHSHLLVYIIQHSLHTSLPCSYLDCCVSNLKWGYVMVFGHTYGREWGSYIFSVMAYVITETTYLLPH